MRISHLTLRRKMEDIKSKITDKEFFTSSLFRGYLADMADATGKRYRKPIKLIMDWDERDDADAAYTNNQSIYINAASSITKDLPTRAMKAEGIIGKLAHEVGHILFSDFEGLARFKGTFDKGEFYPYVPIPNNSLEQAALDEIADILNSPQSHLRKMSVELIVAVTFGILNIIEDIYIEARLCHMFPGSYRSGINLINGRVIENILPLQQQIDEDRNPLAIITSLILCYARSGDIKNPEKLDNIYTQTIYNCIPHIDAAVYSDDVNVRYNGANMVLLNIWLFIKEVLDAFEEQTDDSDSDAEDEANNTDDNADNAAENSSGNASEELLENLLNQLQESMNQGGSTPTGTNKPVKSKTADKSPNEPSTEPLSQDSADTSSSANTKDFVVVEQLSILDNLDYQEIDSDVDHQEVVAHEVGRIPLEQTNEIDTSGDGGFDHNREYEGSGYSSATTDVERMMNTMAREMVSEDLEVELQSELQDFSDGIRYGDVHKGIKVQLNRMTHVDENFVEDYNAISSPLISLSKRLQKQVSQLLKDRCEGGKLTGLLYGKRFSARDSIRGDGKQFYNTRLPKEPMEIAVSVLVDESGSMRSKDRATMARCASIVLYDFCRGLDIPIAIYGHTSHGRKKQVEIYAHAEFNSIDNRDKYRLMDISARGSNRDGAALRFTAERLYKRPEPLKLLFLISDGQPYDGFGYFGTAAEEDLRGIKQEYTRKGIKMFCAAIGDDKPNIERIYGDGFLDITDINKLPQNLCLLLSKYIKAM